MLRAARDASGARRKKEEVRATVRRLETTKKKEYFCTYIYECNDFLVEKLHCLIDPCLQYPRRRVLFL